MHVYLMTVASPLVGRPLTRHWSPEAPSVERHGDTDER